MKQINLEIINNIESVLSMFEIKNDNIELKENTNEKDILIKTIEVDEVDGTDQLIFDLFNENNEFDEVYIEEDFIRDLDILEGIEGREQLIIHIKKERSQIFMKKCKRLYELRDKLMHCEVCGFSFSKKYGELGKGFIEGHHTKPISELTSETKIKASEILMVCSNCHRIIHSKYPCLTKEDVVKAIKNNDI